MGLDDPTPDHDLERTRIGARVTSRPPESVPAAAAAPPEAAPAPAPAEGPAARAAPDRPPAAPDLAIVLQLARVSDRLEAVERRLEALPPPATRPAWLLPFAALQAALAAALLLASVG